MVSRYYEHAVTGWLKVPVLQPSTIMKNTLGHLLLILCFRSEKFPMTYAGGRLIIHYYNLYF